MLKWDPNASGQHTHLRHGYAKEHFECPRYRCICIHIPKTGGVTVKRVLWHREGFNSHITALDYRDMTDPEVFRTYFKFTFVRNPWDRFLSAYRFLSHGPCRRQDHLVWKQVGHLFHGPWQPLNQRYTLEQLSLFCVDTPEFICKVAHFIPQHWFVLDEEGKCLVDYVARFENFDDEMKTICRKLGAPVPNNVPVHNKVSGQVVQARRQNSRAYRGAYSSTAADAVGSLYAKDIDTWGYQF